mmetsp:Transcript_63591/g.127533  ORF Transcript_63591/g.127533 Transcript_63591/m.127533 type:complete len:183 (-) Transcript_63591:105-653(-)
MHEARRSFAAAPLLQNGRKVLVHGGVSTPVSKNSSPDRGPVLATLEVLDLSGQDTTWQLVPLPFPRVGHSMAALQGRIYFCGGISDYGGAPVSTVVCLDLDAYAFVESTPMAVCRTEFGMVAMAGSLHVFGGLGSFGHGTPAFRGGECFNPFSGTWEPSVDMAQGRKLFSVAMALRVGTCGA